MRNNVKVVLLAFTGYKKEKEINAEPIQYFTTRDWFCSLCTTVTLLFVIRLSARVFKQKTLLMRGKESDEL